MTDEAKEAIAEAYNKNEGYKFSFTVRFKPGKTGGITINNAIKEAVREAKRLNKGMKLYGYKKIWYVRVFDQPKARVK